MRETTWSMYLRKDNEGGGGPAEESLGVVGGSPLLHAMLQ